MEDELEKFREQHIKNYREAIIENIKNNTNILVDEDIMSLLKKPPLDSMDLIKSKMLDIAKKNKVIINSEKLDKVLDNYRLELVGYCEEIKKIRIDFLCEKVNKYELKEKNSIIKINKKDFIDINKKIKKTLKDAIKEAATVTIVKKINTLFVDEKEEEVINKISEEVNKYINGAYQRQALENVDFKILVKDTTLISSTKEQAERYLFTMANSRLFKEDL